MKTTNIILRCSEREKELVRERAEALQMSMSEYILNLIRLDIKK